MTLPNINAIWIGSELGPIHAACLASFVRTGHSVTLHCYETVTDLPSGVIATDASRLIPASEIDYCLKTGALAFASDLLRYEILKLDLGLYIDVDVYCHSPMEDAAYIFGWEDSSRIANGVLKLPATSPALAMLLAIRRKPDYAAAWVGRRRRVRRLLRHFVKPNSLDVEPWGWAGPAAVTWALTRTDEAAHALPPDVFYPLDYRREALFFDPELTLDDITTSRTRYIHIYHQHRKDAADVPPSSPVGRIIAASKAR